MKKGGASTNVDVLRYVRILLDIEDAADIVARRDMSLDPSEAENKKGLCIEIWDTSYEIQKMITGVFGETNSPDLKKVKLLE